MVYEAMARLSQRDGDEGLSPTATLKNVGLICDPCGAGKHYDCVCLTDPTKHMCLCNYTTHPYLSREQLTKPLIHVAIPTEAGVIAKNEIGEAVHPRGDKAPWLAKEVR